MNPIRAYLVDDEPLALKRLSRMLAATGRVEIVGSNTDPVNAAEAIAQLNPDLVFLDIEMPGLNGFEMLARTEPQPLVVFTTAYAQYALQAFSVQSIDYLLKPIEAEQLDRAVQKIARMRGGAEPRPDLRQLLSQLAAAQGQQPEYPERISSRTGERVEFVDLQRVMHFFARDKLTYAATPEKNYSIDHTIQELEQKLDPKRFVRIHRSTIVNIQFVQEMHSWFAGRMMIRLKDDKHTELTVARDRVRALKERLGI